ncbi:hypothetical protein SprV_0902716900 [Sparganum proliferum]
MPRLAPSQSKPVPLPRTRRSRLVDSLSRVDDRQPNGPRESVHLRESQASFHLSEGTPSSASIGLQQESAVQRLEPAATNLAKVIEMVINFENDATAAANNVQKLTRLLDSDSSPENQYSACAILHKLAQKQASRNGLAVFPQVLESLVHLLQTTHDIETQTEASLALRQLCNAKPAASAIGQYLPIPTLVQLLSHPTETIMLTALSILHKMMLYLPERSRPEVRSCGGPIHLTALFSTEYISDPNWLIVCCDAIRMTAYEDEETKLILLDSDLPTKVVHLFRTVRKEKLHYALARLVKVLSVCTECKQGLVEAGAVQALTSLLSSSHDSLVLEALWGLRNMSDQAFHLTDTNELLRLLVPLLSSSVEHIAICAAGCLCNLSCQNSHNKATVVELGGVPALCACMRRFLTRDEVTEPVCAALRNVTHRNSRTETALRQIQAAGALGDVVGLLNADSDPSQLPLVKAVVGLVRNLGLDRDCRRELQKIGTTGRLILILKRADGVFEEASRQRGSIVSSSSELSYIEGVRLEDLLELTMVALQSMAMHSPGRSELIQAPDVISLIVRYLYDQSEYLQLASLSFLGEIAVTSDGARSIEEQGAVARITELVQSGNSAIATYSATVLHRMAQSKPVDYQRRLSQELRHALLDGGVVTGQEAAISRSTPSGETNPPLPLPRRAPAGETPLLQLPEVPHDPLPNGRGLGSLHLDSVDGHRTNLLAAKFRSDLRLSSRADAEGSAGEAHMDSIVVEGREAPQLI